VDVLEGLGIDVRLGTALESVDDGAIVAGGERIGADLVVLGLGTRPNSGLAAEAGIEVGVKEAIRVDRRQRTSVDGVWAAGDCCESYHLVARAPVHIALGTVANKQGRVAGINLGGGYAMFPGVVGTAATKVCSTEVARTGLSEAELGRLGLEWEQAAVDSTTRAGYFPGAEPIRTKVLAERGSGRLLGAQIVGKEGAAKRIDVFATAIWNGMAADEMVNMDLSYAPPFSPVWDPVLIAVRKLSEQVERALADCP
jgi:NADPH-dependent 2,4-dienoyl-CoA reductase/sulfur reductase-like enzyme